MAKLTIADFTSLTNQTSFLDQLNAAFDAIEDALEVTLSRDGTTPNQMEANLDMNSKRILNLPAPTESNDPVRLIDLTDGVVVTGEQGPAGDPGGPLADGDYGDIVVSGTGTVISFDTSVVTAAAKTLLDDANVAAMRTTLGLGDVSTRNVGTSAGTAAAGDDSRFTAYTVNGQSGATYTLAVSDAGKLVRQTAAGAHTYTINPFATTAIPVGSVIVLRNAVGAGDLTLSRGAGVAFYINGGTTSANATIVAGGVVTLIHEATDTWLVIGVGVS